MPFSMSVIQGWSLLSFTVTAKRTGPYHCPSAGMSPTAIMHGVPLAFGLLQVHPESERGALNTVPSGMNSLRMPPVSSIEPMFFQYKSKTAASS